jgi:hypothetical protein
MTQQIACQDRQRVLEIVQCVNEAMAENPLLPRAFAPVVDSATTFLIDNRAGDLLDQVLQLYSQLSFASSSLTFVQFRKLASAILSAEGDHPSEPTYATLLAMMSGSKTVNASTMFLIHEPLTVILLLSTTRCASASVKYLKLFLQLCSYSAFNCMQCHNIQLDLLLLAILRLFPDVVKFRGVEFKLGLSEAELTDNVFPLLAAIATFSCSPQVITRMISITSPKRDGTYPVFATKMMGMMGLTMARLVRQPALLIPLGYPDRVIVVEGMQKASLNDGFTFRCSFLIDLAVTALGQARSCLLAMKDQKGNHIVFYIQGTSVICRVKSPRGTSLYALGSSFPSCTWCDVIIILRVREAGGITSLAVNDGPPISYSTGPLPFAGGPLSVTLGGLDEGSESQFETICQLGPFVFHSGVLDNAHEDRLSQFARRKCDVAISPLFAYPYDSLLPVKLPEKTAKIHFTIVDAMIQKQVVNTLLPHFRYLGRMPKDFPQLLIDLLYCLVLTSVEAKKHAFYFPVIGHMLCESPTEKLTYKLYLKFFGLLENSTDNTVITSLLLHIVFNMNLWSAAEAPHLSRIVIH